MLKRILVLGLGNPILCDDTIGLVIIDKAEEKLKKYSKTVIFKKNATGSFDLLHEINHFDCLIIIDSLDSANHQPGTIHRCTLDNFSNLTSFYTVNWHSINLPTLLKIGELYGFDLPEEIIFFGIEGLDFTSFSEEPTPALKLAVDPVVKEIEAKIIEWTQ